MCMCVHACRHVCVCVPVCVCVVRKGEGVGVSRCTYVFGMTHFSGCYLFQQIGLRT